MDQILAIAIGGSIGALSRYFTAIKINQFLGASFPYGILFVNVAGSFLIGLLSTILVERLQLPPFWRGGILIGFLGGFTTFSSFALDTVKLFEQGSITAASLNIVSNVIFCLLATLMGIFLGRTI